MSASFDAKATAEMRGQAETDQVIVQGAYRALTILTAINVVSLFDRVQLAALAEPIKAEFGFSDAQIGMLTGLAFGLTYAVAALPLAWLSDRWGRSLLLSLALMTWSVMTGSAALARSFWHLFLSRVGLAGAEAAFTPIAHSLLAEYFPPRRRGFAIGIENSGVSLGIMAGMASAGWVGAHHGWRAALLVSALPGLLLGLVSLIWLRDPRSIERLTPAARPEVRASRRMWRMNPQYVLLVVVAVCHSIMTTGWAQWLPAFFLRSHGLSLAVIGASVGAASGLGLTVGSILGGYVSSRMLLRGPAAPYRICAIVCLLIIPPFAGTLWASSAMLAILCVFLSTVMAGMLGPSVFAGIQNSCDPGYRARATALALCFVTIGSYAIMPLAVGLLSDLLNPRFGQGSLRIALTALLLVPVMAAIIFAGLARVSGSCSARRDM